MIDRDPIIEAALPPYARTADEWWLIVDRCWPWLLGIFTRVGFDLSATLYADDNRAPAVSHDIPFGMHMEELRQKRDAELAMWFQRAWSAAPDSPYIHKWLGWGRLCDLCSEVHVLEEAPIR